MFSEPEREPEPEPTQSLFISSEEQGLVKFNADGVNGRLANSHWDFSSIKQTHLNFLLADIFILFLFSAVRT